MHPEDTSGFRLVGQSDLNGHGDGIQVMPHGETLYVGHFGPSGMGTSIPRYLGSDCPSCRYDSGDAPTGSHTHKVQVADGLLMTNHELFRSEGPAPVGMAVYDLGDPHDPQRLGFFDTGGRGVDRIVYEGGDFAYLGDARRLHRANLAHRRRVRSGQPGRSRPLVVAGTWTSGGETLDSPEGRIGSSTTRWSTETVPTWASGMAGWW